MSEEIKVLLVDDQQLVRDGISALLKLQQGIEVVGDADNGAQAISFIDENPVDVVLMDVRMPAMDGIIATRTIKQKHPELRVIMLTTFDDEEYIVKSLQAGACGYLLKDIPTQDLAQAIRLAHGGIFQLSSSAMGKLVDEEALRQAVSRNEEALEGLTEREVDVLELISIGRTNREIAEELFITEGTVKNHVSRILQQLNLRDRVQAAIYGIKNGLGEG